MILKIDLGHVFPLGFMGVSLNVGPVYNTQRLCGVAGNVSHYKESLNEKS